MALAAAIDGLKLAAGTAEKILDGDERLAAGPLRVRKYRRSRRHDFNEVTFLWPTWCNSCGVFLKGLLNQGERCLNCRMHVCRGCANTLDDTFCSVWLREQMRAQREGGVPRVHTGIAALADRLGHASRAEVAAYHREQEKLAAARHAAKEAEPESEEARAAREAREAAEAAAAAEAEAAAAAAAEAEEVARRERARAAEAAFAMAPTEDGPANSGALVTGGVRGAMAAGASTTAETVMMLPAPPSAQEAFGAAGTGGLTKLDAAHVVNDFWQQEGVVLPDVEFEPLQAPEVVGFQTLAEAKDLMAGSSAAPAAPPASTEGGGGAADAFAQLGAAPAEADPFSELAGRHGSPRRGRP